MDSVLAAIHPEVGAGGFTKLDGTIQFYARINALLDPSMVVVDLGAGRGCQFEDHNRYRREMITIRGKVKRVIGVDVDPAVLTNRFVDDTKVYDGHTLPFDEESVDLIFCDWVLEHLKDPAMFSDEIARVLKHGGWFCARTPCRYSIIAMASRLIPNRLHAKALTKVQNQQRKAEDVFPAFYRLNTRPAVRRFFPSSMWEDYTYTFSPAPSYHFGRSSIAWLVTIAQYLKAPFGGENLLVFVRKTGAESI